MKINFSLFSFRKTITLGLVSIVLLVALSNPINAQSAKESKTKPWYELGMMVDPILDQIFLFYLAMTYTNQSDIGECFDTASKVKLDDPDSWANEWTATANRLQRLAVNSEKEGNTISAGQQYLRSATYYSAALHRHNHPKAPLVKKNTRMASASFKKAIELLKLPVEPVQIPYEDGYLPGYFFKSPVTDGPAPVMIIHQGRDGWAIHDKYLADAAIKRGYHCLLFDGPGQGVTLRLQGLPFRYDWENVITPVVDFVVQRSDVDPDRIGLMGLSMGGSLAPRAAAFEKRIKVCVANPGVLNWSDIPLEFMGNFDPELKTLWKSNPEKFNKRIEELGKKIPLIAWGIDDMMWKHGVETPADWVVDMQNYSNLDIVSKITCKVLVMDGTDDDFSQGKELFEALKCPKDYMLFTAEDTGLQHCQAGALGISSERIFDWLDKNLK